MAMKKILSLLITGILFFTASGQLKSPDDFLGYQLGTRFTPHYRIVNYFDHAAAAMPQMVKLERYGFTNENRELLIAVMNLIVMGFAS